MEIKIKWIPRKQMTHENTYRDDNIRLFDKNSESDFCFFHPPKSEKNFQQHWESEYFFRKKTITPPFKLYGRSLKEALAMILTKKIICFGNW